MSSDRTAEHTWYTSPDQPDTPAPGDLVVAEGIWSPDWVRSWTGVLGKVRPKDDMGHWCTVTSTYTLWHAHRIRRLTPEELAVHQLNGGVPTEPRAVRRGAP